MLLIAPDKVHVKSTSGSNRAALSTGSTSAALGAVTVGTGVAAIASASTPLFIVFSTLPFTCSMPWSVYGTFGALASS